MVEISSASASPDLQQLTWSPHRQGTKVIRFARTSQFRNSRSQENISISSSDGGNYERTAVIYKPRGKGLSPRSQDCKNMNDVLDLAVYDKQNPMKKTEPILPWNKLEHYLPNHSWFEPRPTIDRVVGLTLHCFSLSVLVLVSAGVRLMSTIAQFLAFMFLHSAIQKDKLAVIPLSKDTVAKSSIAQMGNVHLVLGKVEHSPVSKNRPSTNQRTSPKQSRRKDAKKSLSGNKAVLKGLKGDKQSKKNSSLPLPGRTIHRLSTSSPSLTPTPTIRRSDDSCTKRTALEEVHDNDDDFDLSDSSTVRQTLTDHSIHSDSD